MRIRFILCGFLLSITSLYTYGQSPATIDSLLTNANPGKKVENINTASVEYAPSISADGKTIVFESNKTGSYKLYESKIDASGKWLPPISIDSINNYGDDTDLIAGPNISFDGNTMYLFGSFAGGVGADDIYYSIRNEYGWSAPINIGKPINSREFEGFPSISADGKTLYFVRFNTAGAGDKELRKTMGSQTCYSIYKSERGPDRVWSVPTKLPYPINQDCEKSPRIMADNKTLIFSSNKLGGKGNYDLYQSQLNDAGDWTTLVALDYVNSPLSDQFPCISAQGDVMFYVYNSEDIYSVGIPPEMQQFKNNVIQGFVRDGKDGKGLYTDIIVRDAFTSNEVMTIHNNPSDGRYSLVLAVGRSYNVEFRKDGYTKYAAYYDLIDEENYKELINDIILYESAILNLNVYDIEIFEPIDANIIVKVEGEPSIMLDMVSDRKTGSIAINLPLGKAYEVFIDKKNFESEYFVFDISGLMIYPQFEKDIELKPKKKNYAINVADLTNNRKVRSRVRIRNKNRDETIIVAGNETVALRMGDRYEIEATSDQGYAFNSTIIDVADDDGSVGAIATGQVGGAGVELKLQPLLIGADLTLKDILFESNSDQLTENSFAELLRVVGLMYSNPTLDVEIAAHTDDVGSDSYNRLLSERRAKSVVEFLIENEIINSRFVPKGYGEAQPLVANDTEGNRSKNRRVVLKILAI